MAPKRNFRAGDIWALSQVSDPDLSSGGAVVAYVVGVPDPAEDRLATSIWIAPTDGSSPPRAFSSGPKDTAPRWAPDGRSLAYVSDRGDEPQLYIAPLDGGEPKAVTAAPFGVSTPAWSPDSRRLAYAARTGEWKKRADRTAVERSAPTVVTALNNRFDSVGRFDDRRGHIFVVGVGGGDARQVTDGDWDDADPVWSPAGDLLAFTSDRSPTRGLVARRDVWVVAVDSKRRPRRLTRGRGTAVGPQFSVDGSMVSYVGHEHAAGDSSRNAHLMVVSTDGSQPPRSLSAALDRTVWGLIPSAGRAHAWSADGTEVYFLANHRGTQGIYRARVSPDTSVPALVVGGERQVVAMGASGDTMAFVAQWTSSPPEVSCATLDGSAERRVSAANVRWAAEVKRAPLRRLSHQAGDGTTIDSYILYPPGFSRGRPAPTVLDIHGGPHGWHPQAAMTPLYQALAAAGYVVVLPNPRGSHGYGEDFAGRCVGDWGGADFEDLMGAVDSLVERRIADPEHLYIGGYSYGGYMTAWAVGHTDRFRAACVSAPVANLVSMFGTTDIPYFSEFEGLGDPWQRAEYYVARSPVSYLPRVTTPVLVLHWEGDLRCPIGQGEEVFQGLTKLGKSSVLVRYPGGFHVTRSPSQMEDFIQRHLDWFAAH